MGNADQRHTFNPALHFDVVSGQYDIDFFLNRTISFTLEDHARRYDEFRWVIDNRDGAMTDIKNIVLGLTVRVRIGYVDDTQSWRTFIISRMAGGVGVLQKAGADMPAVGSNESTIEYSGRNRNAPDLKGRKRKKRAKGTAREPYVSSLGPTGKGGKLRKRAYRGGSTGDVTQLDSAHRNAWHGPLEGNQRIFNVRHVSDVIREIARRQGYTDERMHIQDTDDDVDHIVIPTGMSDAQYVEQQARKLNWDWKLDGRVCRFHEHGWKGAQRKIKAVFTYGGPDILTLNIDFDFNLPTPSSVKVAGYNPMKRGLVLGETDGTSSAIQNKVAMVFAFDDAGILSPDKAQRKKHLMRSSVYNIPGGSKGLANLKAQNEFIRRNIRAMKLSVQLVGNPDIEGGDTVKLKGTGCPLVDGDWFVDIARHIFNGTTYVTELDLRPPSKQKGKGKSVLVRGEVHDTDATDRNLSGYSHVFVRGRDAELRKLGLATPGSAKVGGR